MKAHVQDLTRTGPKARRISTKTNDYGNNISYFKVVDKELKNKLQPILSQICDSFLSPIWKSKDNCYMVKVNKKLTNPYSSGPKP